MPSPESELLAGARRLEEETLGEIYDTYSPELYRYAYRLLGHVQSAEDLLAETFYRFLRALHAGGGPHEHLRSYLYRVAHNLAMDRFRSQPTDDLDPNVEDHTSSEESVAEITERAIEAQETRDALWKLTADQRQVLVLKFFQGLTNAEVAAALGKPVGAVKALQHRGLNALRRQLDLSERQGEG